jgi:hypothetical protein
MLTYLCNARALGSWDPVTATVLDLLTGKLQFCLSCSVLIAFRGHANLVYPYHRMSPVQKDFIRVSMQVKGGYTVCNESVTFHSSPGDPERLDTVAVLEAMCSGSTSQSAPLRFALCAERLSNKTVFLTLLIINRASCCCTLARSVYHSLMQVR